MSSRRHIREAVVQFLYAADPTEPFLPAPSDSPALGLLLEPLRARLTVARARATAHLQQGRSKFLDDFREVAVRLARLDLGDQDESALPSVRALYDAEVEIRDTLDLLQRELNGNRDPARLQGLLDQLQLLNQQSRAASARFHDTRTDFPALVTLRRDAIRLTEPLATWSERLNQVLDADPADLPELKAVRKALAAINSLREEVTARITALAKALPKLDERINGCLENFRPERVDRVDRAILRLATHELLNCPDIPAAVTIDEAIELARAFGNTDSPRFVNGILDRIRRDVSESTGNL